MFPVIKIHWEIKLFFFLFTMNIIIISNTPKSEIRSRHITVYLFGENNIFNDVLNNHRINYAWQKYILKKPKKLPELKDQFLYIC